ncbi:MAG: aminodeoxychorismate synthase component I [Chlorobiales bacterium]|nr:aminodeoxychorismate synthase component I [Chlorobiales bacterium]
MSSDDSFLDRLAKPGTVLLETSKPDGDNFQSYLFSEPLEIIHAHNAADLPAVFARIEKAIREGLYVAGFLSYEAGYHFEPKALTGQEIHSGNVPLAWFGVYQEPVILNHRDDQDRLQVHDGNSFSSESCRIETLKFSLTKEVYRKKIDVIKSCIEAGDVYQINFTGKYAFDFQGDPVALYRVLKQKQPVPYGAFVRTGDTDILSFSPELFFRIDNGHIQTKPMKGTAMRGQTPEQDAHLVHELQQSQKNRAENLMIVDLLRNDIGRICKPGSVEVTELFSVETYPTLHQMTSTVKGVLREDVRFYDLFKAIFPCGSVTGAPKIRAMQIIQMLEGEERGIYTGAIGFISPQRNAVFNVAIRTVTIQNGRGEMGSGSGVVWDSDADEEYRECELKAAFLSDVHTDYELIETMLWDGDYPLLDKHFARLSRSAAYFGFTLELAKVRLLLQREAKGFDAGKKYKVRLTLNCDGSAKIESAPIGEGTQEPLRVCLSSKRTDSRNIFLYHKTTRRERYDELYKRATQKGFADVLFMNESGHLTEGAISNIIIKKADVFYTPPVACGLLPGVFREHFLEMHKDAVEKKLTQDDLRDADEIFICNAVRGLRKVRLEEPCLD